MTAAFAILAALPGVVAAALATPWIAERLRRPMSVETRGEAPGEFVRLASGVTHYQWHGSRSDRILVLVHGLSSPSWVFDGLIRGLVGLSYRVLTYDLYGRGFSDRPADPQTLDFHARQLGELLDAINVQVPVSVLGYSLGGAIAARFAATESDRVDRLILLAPAGMGYRPPKLLARARDTGPFGDWLWGLVGPLVLRRAADADIEDPTVLPDLPERIRDELRRRGYLAAILSSERNALSESVEEDHREIAAMYIPTLAIWGEADETIPITSVGQLAHWNRQAHQEVVPGADHALAYARPTQVLDLVREFLHDVPA